MGVRRVRLLVEWRVEIRERLGHRPRVRGVTLLHEVKRLRQQGGPRLQILLQRL